MFIILLFTILFLFFSNNTDVTTKEIRTNISTVNEATFNITEEIVTYTNLYEEEPTVRNVVFNIAHGIAYGVIVEINTILPIVVETAGGKYASTIMKFIILYLIIMFIFFIPRFITMVIALVFFIREKRKGKTRFWE